MEYNQEIISIKGMRCSKCVSVTERMLNEMDGVEKASVSLSKNNLT